MWDRTDDTCHLNGTARMGDDPRDQRRQCRLPQLGHSAICGSATARCFRRSAGVNPSLTIQAIACRTADRIRALAARGEL